jgi:hypothetical protein
MLFAILLTFVFGPLIVWVAHRIADDLADLAEELERRTRR